MQSTLINLNPVICRIIFIICIIACAVLPVDPPLALALGIAVVLIIGNPFADINQKAVHALIQISVVGLGFGVNLFHAYEAGKQGLVFTILTIVITFIAGYFVGKFLKVDSKTSFLISNGTAVCGGSAIAAVAPIINADEKQLSVSLGTILILNSVALLIFPFIGHYLGMSESQFGTWCAIAIHDTSSVVGASSKYGEQALQVAATIKLERALWIIPIALITAWIQKRHGIKIKIPYFIFFYIIAMVIATYYPRPEFGTVFLLSRKGLVLVLFLVGAGLSLDKLKSVGWKPFIQGIILWFLISIVSLIVIKSTI
jgi:uncharacterized integral membrane protein (TIGR00698 family)